LDHIYVFVAGYAKQNNGDAGIGICFHSDPDGEPLFEEAEHIGTATQNSAVYHAIIRALEKVCGWKFKNITIYSDNRLVVSQLTESMQARAPNITPLYDSIKELGRALDKYTVKFIPGKKNLRSRELARAAALASPDTITGQALQFEVYPGITGLILAFTPKLMIIRFKYNKGAKIGMHKHIHEQGSYILKGSLKYTVADREIIMRKGAGLVVSGNAEHQIEALEDTVEIVTYCPMRADLLNIN